MQLCTSGIFVQQDINCIMSAYAGNGNSLSLLPSSHRLLLAGPCHQDKKLTAVTQRIAAQADPVRRWFWRIMHREDQFTIGVKLPGKETGGMAILPHAQQHHIEGCGISNK